MFDYDDFFEDLTHQEIKGIILNSIYSYREEIEKYAEQDKRKTWVKQLIANAQGRLTALENLCDELHIELEE